MEIAPCPTAWSHYLLGSKRLGQFLFSKSVILCIHSLSRRIRLAPLHTCHYPWLSSHGLGMASVHTAADTASSPVASPDPSSAKALRLSIAQSALPLPCCQPGLCGDAYTSPGLDASLRCIHSLLWTPASLCWPWGNTSQRISCLWLWSLINGRLFFSPSDLSNIICHRKTKVSLTVCHMNGPDKVFASL